MESIVHRSPVRLTRGPGSNGLKIHVSPVQVWPSAPEKHPVVWAAPCRPGLFGRAEQKITDFNFIVPVARLQKLKLSVADELAALGIGK